MFNIPSISITAEILAPTSTIDEFKGSWRAFGTISPERLDALRRVTTIESIGSSTRIEGNKLSDREVEKLMSGLSKTSFVRQRLCAMLTETRLIKRRVFLTCDSARRIAATIAMWVGTYVATSEVVTKD